MRRRALELGFYGEGFRDVFPVAVILLANEFAGVLHFRGVGFRVMERLARCGFEPNTDLTIPCRGPYPKP